MDRPRSPVSAAVDRDESAATAASVRSVRFITTSQNSMVNLPDSTNVSSTPRTQPPEQPPSRPLAGYYARGGPPQGPTQSTLPRRRDVIDSDVTNDRTMYNPPRIGPACEAGAALCPPKRRLGSAGKKGCDDENRIETSGVGNLRGGGIHDTEPDSHRRAAGRLGASLSAGTQLRPSGHADCGRRSPGRQNENARGQDE